MKRSRIIKRILFLFVLCFILFLAFAPLYLKKSLIYWYPNLDDYKIFANNELAPSQPSPWPLAASYNAQKLPEEALKYLEAHQTTAFLIIKDKKIIYEQYWRDCADSTASNLFSATKSIVSLLVGIAIDEGKIKSVNENIGKYIPEFAQDKRGKITIRNLLTMSSGLDWNETYSSPLSVTTQAYYGKQLRKIVTQQKQIETSGKYFKYLSGNTQLLAYIVEKASGMTISQYAQEKIWKAIGATHKAIWSKDGKDGDERAFCCFHTNAKDIARIAQLILNNGKWKGRQIVSEKYLHEATLPAEDLLDKDGKTVNFYGYQWWILQEHNMVIPYMRGHKGQYIYSIPQKNAVVVRLGEKTDKNEIGPITEDISMYLKIALALLD